MKKFITILASAIATLFVFLTTTLTSCKIEDTSPNNTFKITLYNPYDYPVYITSSVFKNSCTITDKKTKECEIGARETKTYTGELSSDNDYVAIYFEDITDPKNQKKSGIFDFYDAKAGEYYCAKLVNFEERSPQNKPSVFLSSDGNCNFLNTTNDSGNNNGNPDDKVGTVAFWCNNKEDAGGFVQFNNRLKEQFLYYFDKVVPDCYEKGTISYHMPPGDYQYELYWIKNNHQTYNEQKGVVTIKSGVCTKILVQKK